MASAPCKRTRLRLPGAVHQWVSWLNTTLQLQSKSILVKCWQENLHQSKWVCRSRQWLRFPRLLQLHVWKVFQIVFKSKWDKKLSTNGKIFTEHYICKTQRALARSLLNYSRRLSMSLKFIFLAKSLDSSKDDSRARSRKQLTTTTFLRSSDYSHLPWI